MANQPLFVFKERTMFSDTETFSSVDLKKCGLYKYFDAPDAEIMLLAYAFDNDPVTVIDLAQGETVPQEFLDALQDPKVIKRAFNAAFERQAYYKHFGIYCDPESWRCTMVLGMSLGLPGSLAMQAKVLNMPIQKMGDVGKDGIKKFCVPIKKPLKKHGYRTRNLPHHFPEAWDGFKRYNARDVEAERGLYCRLAKYDQPCLWPAWALDQRINDRGVMIDMDLVDNAIRINDIIKAELIDEARRVTGLSNPNSVQQLIAWLNDAEEQEDRQRALLEADAETDPELDIEARITDLRKKTVIELLGTVKSKAALRVLKLRQLMAKSSVTKYRAMQRSVCRDGRIRGLLQFYGAARTGRWAGRIVQVQNLPQNHMADLELARSLVKSGDIPTLKLLWGEAILQVLSELIRTAFIPAPGNRFIAVDFSAIEARLTAWDAQEQWRLEVFRTHGLIYEASASKMFKVPMELITKGHPLRQKGKVTELACLGPQTMVLTDRGYVPIVEVTLNDKLWDGEKWVNHAGVIHRGYKQVLKLDGVTMTPDHLILAGSEWFQAQRMKADASILSRALETGRDSSRKAKTRATSEPSANCKPASPNWSDVYDIALAGPLNRFTIRTGNGQAFLSHNCGYQGGPNALVNMGALEGKDAMQEHELLPAVRLWRAESPNVVNNWYRTQDDAMEAIKFKRAVKRDRYGFEYRSNTLFQVLPSGRKLAYPNARIEYDKKFERDAIVFDGIDQYTHQWKTQKTFGGKIFQNRTQANGVDLIIRPSLKLDRLGLPIVFSVHDENVLEVDINWMPAPSAKNPKKSEGVVYVESIMCEPQPGFAGLPLAADGADMMFYQK